MYTISPTTNSGIYPTAWIQLTDEKGRGKLHTLSLAIEAEARHYLKAKKHLAASLEIDVRIDHRTRCVEFGGFVEDGRLRQDLETVCVPCMGSAVSTVLLAEGAKQAMLRAEYAIRHLYGFYPMAHSGMHIKLKPISRDMKFTWKVDY